MNDRIVPPRPNLGPEPWDDRSSTDLFVIIAFALFIINVLLFFYKLLMELRTSARSKSSSLTASPANDDPQAVWVAWSNRVRAALDREFGAGHSARTTEEIEDDSAIKTGMNADRRDRLIAFLRAADHAKFGGESIALDPETRLKWDDWVQEFCRTGESSSNGKTSKQTGANKIHHIYLSQ